MQAETLRLERLRRRLTQYDVFALCGIRPARLSLMENGRLEPREDELRRWKRALGLDIGESGEAKTAGA